MTSGPHIAYLCADSGIAAGGSKGASVHMRSICTALRRAGARISLQCARTGAEPGPLDDCADTCHEFPPPEEMKRLQRELRSYYGPELKLPAEVRQLFLNRALDPYLESLWRENPPDAVLERLSLFGVAGSRVARRLGLVHLLEVNALLSEEARTHRGLHDFETARVVENEALHNAARIFCVSTVLRDRIVERGVPPDKVEVLPNGFDERRFRPRSAMRLRRRLDVDHLVVIGLVGSFKPWHGTATLLEAFRLIAPRRSVALLLIGAGPEQPRVDEFVLEHPRLRVIAPGAVPHEQVPEYVAACDITVAPYDAGDHFYFSPMKVFEYMAMSKPVVASDVGQLQEVIRSNENGLLVPPGDPPALAAALKRLYADPSLRTRLGETARRDMRGRTWLSNARRILEAVEMTK